MLRASVFAVVATSLAAIGHVNGGGHSPDPAILIVLAMLVAASVSGLADRRLSGLQITAMLAASQVCFHLLFEVTAHQSGSVDVARMVSFHLFAAAASAWVMTVGESALFRLFAALHRLIVRLRAAAPICITPSWTAILADQSCPGQRRSLAASVTRRGPPVALWTAAHSAG
jgi:hypothetical protein